MAQIYDPFAPGYDPPELGKPVGGRPTETLEAGGGQSAALPTAERTLTAAAPQRPKIHDPFAQDYEPPPEGVVLPSIKRVAGQFVESVGTTIEDITGENAVTRGLQDFGGGVVKANPSQINSVGDILENPWTTIKEAVAEQVPQLGAAFTGARLGAMAGTPLGPVGVAGGALIGGIAPIAIQDYGEIRGKQKETGEENIPLAIAGAGGATALERFGLEKLATKAGAKGFGEVLDAIPEGTSRLAHAGKQGLKTALVEGPGTEIPQTAIERYAGGQEIGTADAFDEYALAGAKGAIGGGVIGGGLGLVAPREQAPSPQPYPARGEGEDAGKVDDRTLTPGDATPPAEGPGVEEPEPDGWGDALTAEQRQHMASINEGHGSPLAPPPLSSGPLGRAAAAGGITAAAPVPANLVNRNPDGQSARSRGPLSPLGAELAAQGKADVAAEQARMAQLAAQPSQPSADPAVKRKATELATEDNRISGSAFAPPELRFHKLNTARTEANALKFAEGLVGRFPHLAFEAVPHRLTKGKFAVKASPRTATTAVDQAAHQAATSPQNDLPQPTEPQKEAGNYQKGHVRYAGLDISIENPTGSKRSGVGPDGTPWEVEMSAHYGYVRRTNGNDGEQVDVYLASEREDTPAFVVDQIDPKSGKFDEHKVVLGAASREEAEATYDAHFSDQSGPSRRRAVSEVSVDEFKTWLADGNTKAEFAPQSRLPSNKQVVETSTKQEDAAVSGVASKKETGVVQATPPAATIDAPQQAAGLTEEGGVDASRATELQPPPQFEQRPAGLRQGTDSGAPGVEEPAPELPVSDNAGILPGSAAADGAEAGADVASKAAPSGPLPGSGFQALAAAPASTPVIPPTQSPPQEEIAAPGARPAADSSPDGAKTHETHETPADAKPGLKATVKTASGRSAEVHYALAEADDLVVSNDEAGHINPDYPKELQPRDRSRVAMQAQVATMAGSLDPARLGDSQLASQGAPIIGPDGVIESGNGRSMAISRAYRERKAEPYRRYLEENAERFGIDHAAIQGMRAPVLVRRRTSTFDDTERLAFVREANQTDVAAMSPVEQAFADAARLDAEAFATYRPSEDGDILARSNDAFRAIFLKGLSSEERNALMTADGRATKQLVDRIQAAVFARAYGDERLLGLLAEEADPDIKTIVNALNAAAGAFVRARSLNEGLTPYNIIPALVEGADFVRETRRTGQAVQEAIAQQDLFGGRDPNALALAMFMDANKRSPKRLGEGFRAMAEFIEKELSRAQNQNLFAETPPTLGQVIARVNDFMKERYGQEDAIQPDLFSQPERSAPIAQARPESREPEEGARGAAQGAEAAEEVDKPQTAPDRAALEAEWLALKRRWGSKKLGKLWKPVTPVAVRTRGEELIKLLSVKTEKPAEKPAEKKPFKEHIAELREARQKRDAKFLAHYERDGSVYAVSQRDPTLAILLTESTTKDGEFRVTTLRNGEPTGHREYKHLSVGIDNAFSEFASSDYKIGPAPSETKVAEPETKAAGRVFGQADGLFSEAPIEALEIEKPIGVTDAAASEDATQSSPVPTGLLSIADLLRGAVRDSDGRPFAPVDGGARYSYLGWRAAAADFSALTEARKLSQQGVSREEIRERTGWFKGKDNKWRFEISDKAARLKLDWDAYGNTIGDALDHKALFENYPSLAKIELVFRLDLPENAAGGYSPGENAIHLNANLAPKAVKSTLLHELQHVVQVIEDFARGGNPTDPAFIAAAASIGIDAGNKDAMTEAYRRLMGEVEARDVQARMDLTAEELLARPPYVSQGIPESDFIVRHEGAFAASQETQKPGPAGRSVSRVRETLAKHFGAGVARLIQAGTLRIVQHESELPPHLNDGKGGIRGVYDPENDTTWMVADNLTAKDAPGVFLHELGVHFGLERMLGSEKYQEIIRQMKALEADGNEAVRAGRAAIPEGTRKEALDDELIAYLVEKHPDLPLVKRIIAAIRAFLFRLGVIKNIRPEDVVALARAAARHAASGAAINRTGSAGSLAPAYSGSPLWYSEMAKFIDAKAPGKTTSAQWKVLLDGWAKAGKFKGEELEWSGVKEWLDLESQPRFKPAIKIIGGVDDGKILTTDRTVIHAQIPYRASEHKGITTTDLGFLDRSGRYHTKAELGMDASQLAAVKPTITKDQVLGFVRENGVRVEETTLSDEVTAAEQITAEDVMARSELIPPPNKDSSKWKLKLPDNDVYLVYAREDQGGEANARAQFLTALQRNLKNPERHKRIARAMSDVPPTKFAQWQLPGGENYREVLLRLPPTGTAKSARVVEGNFEGHRFGVFFGDDMVDAFDNRADADAAVLTATAAYDTSGDFRSTHFDQTNILAHVRFNERVDADGRHVLFIEEIQSDWAQKGKRERFERPKEKARALVEENAAREAYNAARDAALKYKVGGGDTGGQQYQQLNDAIKVADERLSAAMGITNAASGNIPSAPFVGKTEAWVSLALKRMISYGSENGFDRVAWTTGEQQAKRYDLSKHLDSVSVRKAPSDRGYVVVGKKGNIDVFGSGVVPRDKLVDHIGKDLADKALAELDAMEKNPAKTEFNNEYQGVLYQGLDLKVGGEGMRAFYDQIVPNVANALLKKLGGGRVGEVELPKPFDLTKGLGYKGGETTTQPGFDITPALRESAMRGLPLFSRVETRRGIDAARQVLDTKADVHNAMRSREYGQVTFIYGEPGEAARKYKDGYGLSHIVAKHGRSVLDKVIETVAYGKTAGKQTAPRGDRVLLSHAGHTAVLSLYRHGNEETWLLTGWDERDPGGTTGVYGPVMPMLPSPMRFRTEEGAGPESTIAAPGGPVKGPQGPLYSRAPDNPYLAGGRPSKPEMQENFLALESTGKLAPGLRDYLSHAIKNSTRQKSQAGDNLLSGHKLSEFLSGILSHLGPRYEAEAQMVRNLLPYIDPQTIAGFTSIDTFSHGVYKQDVDAVNVRFGDRRDPVELILHETIHAVTARAVSEGLGDGVFSPSGDPVLRQAGADLAELYRFAKARTQGGDYGFHNEYEFIAEALSNPDFQRRLAKIKLSQALIQRFGEKPNLWSAFLDSLRRILKIGARDKGAHGVLDAVIKAAAPLLDVDKRLREMGVRPLLAKEFLAPLYSRGAPPDPSSAEGSAAAVDRIGEAMRTTRHGWDAIKSKMLKDWRPAWLTFFTRRQLVDIGEAMVPALGKYNQAVEAMDADRSVFDDEAHVVAEAAAAYIKGHKKEADVLFDIMHAATLAGVDPALDYLPSISRQEAHKEIASLRRRMRGRPGEADVLQIQIDQIRIRLDNEKVRKQAYPALQKRYAGLSEDARAVYAQMRDLYAKRFDEREAALIQRIEEAEADQRWKARLIADIRARFETARLSAPYFPLTRVGDYWVASVNPDGEKEFHLRESEHQQKALIAELEARGYRAIRHGVKIDKLFAEGGASAGFVTEIIKVIDSRAGPRSSPALERIKDEIYQIYLHTLPEMSARRHWIHRQKTPGFSQDALRGFAKAMFHGNRQLARLRQENAMERALATMRKQALDAADPNRAGQLVNEMQKRDEWIKNPTTASWATAAGGLGFLWYLTAPASAIVNVTQTPLVAYPLLAARHGWGAAAQALMRATSDYFRGRFSVEGALKGEELDAYRRFLADGLIDKTQSHDLAGMSETPSAIYSGRTAKVLRASIFLFHRAERANREITALAAFRLARAKGLGVEAAYQEAKAMTWESHFDYSNANKARFIQGDVARVLFMFKQFSQHMTYLLGRSAHQSLKGLTGAARREARVRLTGLLGMHALFAGALGMPLMGTLAFVMNALFDDEDEPYDFELELRNFLAEAFGPEWGQAIARGPVESLTGLGVAHRVGLSDLWFREPDKTLEGRGLVEYWAEQFLGPLGGIALKAGTAYEMFQDGETRRALESMTPTAIRSGLQMLRYADEGARSLRGDPVMEEVSTWNLLSQAAGFSPAELGQKYDANRALKDLEYRIEKRRDRLIDRWWLARRTGDMEGVQEAMAEIGRFNGSSIIRENPRKRITPATLLASTQSRRAYSRRAEGGIILDRNLSRLPERVRFAP